MFCGIWTPPSCLWFVYCQATPSQIYRYQFYAGALVCAKRASRTFLFELESIYKRSMSKRREKRTKLDPEACVLCRSDENNEFLYGKLFHIQNLSVHENCLFFSSGLSQHGKKKSGGILGFLLEDIKREVCRSSQLRCYYCKKKGASIGCCKSTCPKSFHFPCAVKNRCLHKFFGTFSSYCHLHKPVQKDVKIRKEEFFCHICLSRLSKSDVEDCLYTPCCSSKWFHRTCLQRYALSAGLHFFKCPLCNNSKDFVKEMQEYGIYIPDKDAAWELEENAFQELLVRPGCGALSCQCKRGRKHCGRGLWSLITCSVCGSHARHIYCENLETSDESWKCDDCKDVEDSIHKSKQACQDSLKNSEQNKQVPALNSNQSNTSELSCEPSSSYRVTQDPSLKSITNIYSQALQCVVRITPWKEEDIKTATTSLQALAESRRTKRKLTEELDSINNKVCPSIKTEKRDPKNRTTIILNRSPVKPKVQVTIKSKTSQKYRKPIKFSTGCCQGQTHRCIKIMLGLECKSYRL